MSQIVNFVQTTVTAIVMNGSNVDSPISTYDSMRACQNDKERVAYLSDGMTGELTCGLQTDKRRLKTTVSMTEENARTFHFPEIGMTVTVGPCASDDSANCYYDTRAHEGIAGESFVDINGFPYFMPQSDMDEAGAFFPPIED